jgi:predicted ATP-grasp superfamily ATP-dependent carboligase
MFSDMKVLVLDGNENHAVAATRSLGRAGHSVFVGASTNWSKAGWSRACRETFIYPAPQDDAEKFVAAIAEKVKRENGALVLPMTERTTLPLSAHRERIFAAGGRMVLPPHETVLRAFDKEQTTQLAAALGVVVPKSLRISSRNELERAAAVVNFPVVLKPKSSEEVNARGQVTATGAPVYARDERELLASYETMSARCSAMLLQEFVEGRGVGYFALMRDGELRAEFAHRRIRDVRPTGSGSALRESALPDECVREAGLKILRALKWHGAAMVEFRQRADGTPVFLEVNGRFWNSLPLAVYAGADFPAWVAELAETGDVENIKPYRTGVRCRWLLGDFRHLVEVMRGAPAGFPGEFPKRLPTLWKFLTPVAGTFHDNFTLNDPLPELGDWLDFFARKLPAGLHKRKEVRRANAQGDFSLS